MTADGLSVIFPSAFVQFGRRRLGLGVVRIEFIFEIEIDVEVVHGSYPRRPSRLRASATLGFLMISSIRSSIFVWWSARARRIRCGNRVHHV